MKFLSAFFAKVVGSQKGLLVPEELYRSIVTALGSGGVIGLILTVLQTVLSNTALIFPNPIVGGLATMILTLVVDLLRRQNHGDVPNPAPAPSPAPTPTPAPAA